VQISKEIWSPPTIKRAHQLQKYKKTLQEPMKTLEMNLQLIVLQVIQLKAIWTDVNLLCAAQFRRRWPDTRCLNNTLRQQRDKVKKFETAETHGTQTKIVWRYQEWFSFDFNSKGNAQDKASLNKYSTPNQRTSIWTVRCFEQQMCLFSTATYELIELHRQHEDMGISDTYGNEWIFKTTG